MTTFISQGELNALTDYVGLILSTAKRSAFSSQRSRLAAAVKDKRRLELERACSGKGNGVIHVLATDDFARLGELKPFEALVSTHIKLKTDVSTMHQILFISHKWYTSGPDNAHNHFYDWCVSESRRMKLRYIWVDYCCVPQVEKDPQFLYDIPNVIQWSKVVVYPGNRAGYLDSYWCAIEATFSPEIHGAFSLKNYFSRQDVALSLPLMIAILARRMFFSFGDIDAHQANQLYRLARFANYFFELGHDDI